MRALVIAALGAVLVTAGSGRGRADGSDPALRVVASTPLTVVGTGFAAGERVRLTLRAGRRPAAVRTAEVAANGRFRTSFGLLVAVEPCTGALVVTASGSRGSRASWKRACRPPSTRPPRVDG